jgi:DNA polymerase III alpha subunit|tara:strand:- start:1398 stop:1910 length:513 start_codon:yes stop_codon:yes gene_type:complete
MRTNELHQVIVSESDMIDVLHRGEVVSNLVVDNPNWITQFNQHCDEYGLPGIAGWQEESIQLPEEYIQDNLSNWHLPVSYATFDLENYLFDKCKTPAQEARIEQELIEFKSRHMMPILCWMKYFIDTLRENDMVWGVGRGSSVASYVLYLLDVHRVDSFKYELDIKEFLK